MPFPPIGITGAPNSQFNAALSNDNPELINWMFPVVSTEQQTTIMVIDAVLSGNDRHRPAGRCARLGGGRAVP